MFYKLLKKIKNIGKKNDNSKRSIVLNGKAWLLHNKNKYDEIISINQTEFKIFSQNGEDGIIDSILYTDGSGANKLYIPGGGSRQPASRKTVDQRLHYIKQDGREVYKSAVRGMTDASENILKRNGISAKDLKLFIPHQANKRIIEASAERLGLNKDQILINIEKVANTTAGTIPIGLSEAVLDKRLKEGDLLLISAFGAGFTWGAMLIRWGKCI